MSDHKLQTEQTLYEVIQGYLPGISEQEADYILWNHTGYPRFWNIGVDGGTPEECLRSQLEKYRL